MTRFAPSAAADLRRAIREAGGVEVFAIGDVVDGTVTELTIACRGRVDAVPALLQRPRAGQVVIHNHPSGNLHPSDADMALASRYGDDGVGMVIVDSDVARAHWVVEPHVPKHVPITDADVEAVFHEALPRALPDWESREAQVEMAKAVARAFEANEPFVCEAGTGTGKSLAYLVPAALWAKANDAKVVVSTYTKNLQAQLLATDLPMLAKAGLEVRAAVLEGRNNYLCKRRLQLAVDELEEEEDPELRNELVALREWEGITASGSRTDLPVPVHPLTWERVWSDSDLTLHVKCAHYASCHFYRARREAAGAHIVVVNHALLLMDLFLREQTGQGILPAYQRVVLDEGHHLEDAATGATSRKLTARAVQRAVQPLLDRKKRTGALGRLVDLHAGNASSLPPDRRHRLVERVDLARQEVDALRAAVDTLLTDLAADALDRDGNPRRITPEVEGSEVWSTVTRPRIESLTGALQEAAGALDAVEGLFEEVDVPDRMAQPLLDLRRAKRRIAAHAATAHDFLLRDDDACRWLERARERGPVARASLSIAPIEAGPVLRRILWEPFPGTASTSATMTVAGSFRYWMDRTGVDDAASALFPSPFDHFAQALLALPRDVPRPDEPSFLSASAECVVEAVRISRGGAFVLCTSYAAVDAYAAALQRSLPPTWPLLVQGQGGRASLLARFRENPRSVLVGTDSFWEGVSVKGDGLRLVIIPRLPFRVPTEPLQLARTERIARRGGDPFRAYALPQAVIMLRQGYGRLIRSQTDRGVVLILDRRVHERSYGAIMLRSLPKARRVSAPWRRVREELEGFFGG